MPNDCSDRKHIQARHIKEADAKCVEMMFFLNPEPLLQTNAITGLGGIKHEMKKCVCICFYNSTFIKLAYYHLFFLYVPDFQSTQPHWPPLRKGSKRFSLRQEEVLNSLGTIFSGGLIHTLWLREHLERQDSISKNDTNEDIEKINTEYC